MQQQLLGQSVQKLGNNGHLHIIGSSLQLIKQLDSWEDISWVIIMELVDAIFGFLPSHVYGSKLAIFLASWLIRPVLKQDVVNVHTSAHLLFT